MQSPPGNTTDVKNLTVLQAGIYAVGQLANLPEKPDEGRPIASIIIFKDMTATIALATVSPNKSDVRTSWNCGR